MITKSYYVSLDGDDRFYFDKDDLLEMDDLEFILKHGRNLCNEHLIKDKDILIKIVDLIGE